MKRRIIFRGYNLKNKKWLYGYYFVNRGQHFVVEDGIAAPYKTWEDFEVDPESVGQYVGDYEGKGIYEGDQVEVTSINGHQYTGIVEFDVNDCRFIAKADEIIPITGEEQKVYLEFKETNYICRGSSFYYRYKVIGNEYEEKLKTSNP